MPRNNQRSGCRDNQFRDAIEHSSYEKVCNRVIRLIKFNEKIINENSELVDKVKFLNHTLDNFERDIDDLELKFKCLSKPYFFKLDVADFSLLTLATLTGLLISLFANFLNLKQSLKKWKEFNNYD